jgi:hypothetical protein
VQRSTLRPPPQATQLARAVAVAALLALIALPLPALALMGALAAITVVCAISRNTPLDARADPA